MLDVVPAPGLVFVGGQVASSMLLDALVQHQPRQEEPQAETYRSKYMKKRINHVFMMLFLYWWWWWWWWWSVSVKTNSKGSRTPYPPTPHHRGPHPYPPISIPNSLVVLPSLLELAEERVAAGLRAEGGEDGLGEVAGDDLMVVVDVGPVLISQYGVYR